MAMEKFGPNNSWLNNSRILLALLVLDALIIANGNDEHAWPDIKCHPLYDAVKQNTVKIADNACKDGSHTRTDLITTTAGSIVDFKGCVLWRFAGIHVKPDKSMEFTENKGLRRTLLTIFMGLFKGHLTAEDNKQREEFVESLLKKSEPCKQIFNDLAMNRKLASTGWGPFYDCVNNAWKCSH